ncbi:MAG TPA: response regulator, partial [Anaeromyxobacter sp.]|nr:response regulator [Anaeromyxobacter sp.]
MESKRVLIVEPDNSFALSLASLFQDDGHLTSVAASAADGQREIAARRPDLVLARAELPDASGFALCGRLRREQPGLPVVLYSSDAPHEALEEHARTPAAANGYLGMPLDTGALRQLVSNLLVMSEPLESADDAIVEDEVVEVRPGPVPPALSSLPTAPTPPPVPRRARRSAITDDDRLFLERTFRSISERRADLVAEARRPRPPPQRGRLATPEGKLEVLREDLRAREAQIARLAEVWDARERDVAQADDRMHEKEVELQGVRLQVEDLLRRLAEARDLFVEKEREHGASLEGLLLEKFGQEKELIEVVAAHERKIHELERELRLRDEDLAARKLALDGAAEDIARLERRLEIEAERFEVREQELQELVAEREAAVAELERRRTAELDAAAEDARRHQATVEEAGAARRALEGELEAARAAAERAAAEHAARLAEREANAAALSDRLAAAEERGRAAAEDAAEVQRDLELRLDSSARELEEARRTAGEEAQALRARIDEAEAGLAERDGRLALLDEEYRAFRDAARAREEELSRELQERLERVGELEGDLQATESARAEEGAALRAELEQSDAAREAAAAEARSREERLQAELGSAIVRADALDAALSDERRRAAAAEAEL